MFTDTLLVLHPNARSTDIKQIICTFLGSQDFFCVPADEEDLVLDANSWSKCTKYMDKTLIFIPPDPTHRYITAIRQLLLTPEIPTQKIRIFLHNFLDGSKSALENHLETPLVVNVKEFRREIMQIINFDQKRRTCYLLDRLLRIGALTYG